MIAGKSEPDAYRRIIGIENGVVVGVSVIRESKGLVAVVDLLGVVNISKGKKKTSKNKEMKFLDHLGSRITMKTLFN